MPFFSVPSQNARHTVIVIAAVLVIISIIFVTAHQRENCTFSFDYGNTWQDCQGSYSFICKYPAFSTDYYQDFFAASAEVNMTCPWDDPTLIVGYIALILSLLFIIVFTMIPMMRTSNLINYLLILAIFNMILLFASSILMLIDVIKGYKYTDKLQELTIGSFTFDQTAFIVNAILVFLTFIAFVILSIYAFAIYRARNKSLLTLPEESYTGLLYSHT